MEICETMNDGSTSLDPATGFPAGPSRSPSIGPANGSLETGRLSLDLSRRSVWLNGQQIDLTDAEFDVLWCLVLRSGQVVTRDELYQQVLKTEYDGLDRCIDLRVSRLRKKLGDNARSPRIIRSVRSEGYILIPPVDD